MPAKKTAKKAPRKVTKKKVARKRGRPTKRTPAVERKVLEWLQAGKPLEELCRQKGMPSSRAVRMWAEDDEDFSSDLARARDVGFDAIAWECVEIADNEELDPAARRVRVDTRLKLLACWDRRRYGPNAELNMTGGPLRVVIGGDV